MDAACDCTFAWHSVVPPTHCPKCGRCLGCGQGAYPTPYPVYPVYPVYPMMPWQPQFPWWQPSRITCTTNTTSMGFAA